ncbi:hypothetical protein LIS82_22880 [Cytobacillus solani]|uniref:hypothetical protein n=1 Tax=Cytobacillus solani TaxID=1637975 RepID=UPI002079482C|nr:hypothetical protein [Cytobacillus solani]USK54367.1 hypothetical protein LIS82_22880 [Cytobacillus solani]
MEIFLSTKDRKQIIKLPIIPPEIKVNSPSQNEIYSTISQGDIKLIGPPGLRTISFSSFFPFESYSWAKDRTYKGMRYVHMIEKWKLDKEPIRLVITGKKASIINMLCAIDNIEFGSQDGTTDIYYTLSLSEFKLLPLQKRKV